MMKKIGIWIDKKMAYVISEDEQGTQHTKLILSKIDDYRIHGGSGTRFKGGPQDVVHDSKYLEREKHQFKQYCRRITKYLVDAKSIVIFGPAEAGQRLWKELKNSYPLIYNLVIECVKTDSMSRKQLQAFVRNYYQDKSKPIMD